MEQGPVEARIIKECMRQRHPLPKRMQNAPDLRLGLELFFTAFGDLTTCRTLGFGTVSGIPWTAVDDYCNRLGLDAELRDDMHFYIREMDDAYLKFVQSKTGK